VYIDRNVLSNFFLVFSLLVRLDVKAQPSDFFPLKTGVEQHYTYFRVYSAWKSPLYGFESRDDYSKDSGTVVYKYLTSSIKNDTTIIWTIREIISLTSIEWHLNSVGERDTSYSNTVDSSDFVLYEYTSGFHKLDTYMFVLRLKGYFYRYSITSEDTIMCKINDIYGQSISNTFVKDIGLSNLFGEEHSYGNMSYESVKKEVKLVSIINSINNSKVSIQDFNLQQNYPNPFNPSTVINYSILKQSNVKLIIYDALGREVATLVNEEKQPGSYEVKFQSAVGSPQLASGIYFYQLRAGEFIQTKKMILLR
jgi:hypothetical protein